ncbi:MAG: hypothetical protein IPG93_00375 [Burkholderiales bacterium]|nr:hypothetical protein [Burkholderiales bacterium]
MAIGKLIDGIYVFAYRSHAHCEWLMTMAKCFRALFLVGYLLYIVGSVYLVRENESLSNDFVAIRLLIYILLLLLWISGVAYRLTVRTNVFLLAIILLPYVATAAYLSYVDLLILTILASSVGSGRESRQYFLTTAYASLAVVLCIVGFSLFGAIPTKMFEWQGRVKDGLGFANPNTMYFFVFSAAFVGYYYKSMILFAGCGAVMIGFYWFAQSRAYALCYLILAVQWRADPRWLFGLYEMLVRSWLYFVLALGLLIGLFPIEVSTALGLILGIDVNELLSNRLELISGRSEGRSIWGYLLGGKENDADSLYVYFINSFGLVGVVLFAYYFLRNLAQVDVSLRLRVAVLSGVFLTVGIIEAPIDGSALISLFWIWIVFCPNEMLRDHGIRVNRLKLKVS